MAFRCRLNKELLTSLGEMKSKKAYPYHNGCSEMVSTCLIPPASAVTLTTFVASVIGNTQVHFSGHTMVLALILLLSYRFKDS